MSEWQSIETAPKNRTEVLASVPNWPFLGAKNIRNELLTFREGAWRDRMSHKYYPTHWMPLPPPPTAEQPAAPQPNNMEEPNL